MTKRHWWNNCPIEQEADSEILAIDSLEDQIAPIAANVSKIRELIGSLEMCHHKAEKWVSNILEAIASGETSKGLGTRPHGKQHPAEKVWQNACATLSAWCAGCPIRKVDLAIDTVPASELLACLGERSTLKEWQVQRVVEKIREDIHFPQSCDDPMAQYVWILLGGGNYEASYRSDCPEYYKEHEDFWLTTVRTIIHDTENGDEAELSLGFAIDMLMPCHWRFVENLRIVLEAIGGKLNPEHSFTACARNITQSPIRPRMKVVSNTLKVFCGDSESDKEIDSNVLAVLGEQTKEKKWLAASLDKTIRLQLEL